MSTSISLNAIRHVFEEPSNTSTPVYALPQQPKDVSSFMNRTPTTTFSSAMPYRTNGMPTPQASHTNDGSFDRLATSRNSLTKRYLTHIGTDSATNNAEVVVKKYFCL